jgi:thymidylate synthase (FAD)
MIKIVDPTIELVSYSVNGEKLIERMGRICYRSEERITETSHVPFIRSLIKRGHGSVLEHASASFIVVLNRAIINEIERHRAGFSYSQESSRFCNYSKGMFNGDISIIQPISLDLDGFEDWLNACLTSAESYFNLIKKGAKPEVARDVLPLCLASTLGVTANIRAWRDFLGKRLVEQAHEQVREVSKRILKELNTVFPTCFEDMSVLHLKHERI